MATRITMFRHWQICATLVLLTSGFVVTRVDGLQKRALSGLPYSHFSQFPYSGYQQGYRRQLRQVPVQNDKNIASSMMMLMDSKNKATATMEEDEEGEQDATSVCFGEELRA